MKKLIALTALVTSIFTGYSQITIDATPTPTDLVQNTLIGPGLVTSNITFTGQASQIGFFDGTGTNLGLPTGVVLSSGNVIDVVGLPTAGASTDLFGAGDPEVLATAQSVNNQANSSNDAAVLEFDFVPEGDEVFFTFVFASDEYLTYINTVFNDAFGFYLTGPNPNGGNYNSENIALVPGTTDPISISSIYIDPTETPSNMNGQFFQPSPTGYAFNGATIPIEIRFDVECGQTYHFKFAISDINDGILDSGVFLEGGSFQSIPAVVDFFTVDGDTLTYEACDLGTELLITRPECLTQDSLIAWLSYSGTATYGVDYDPIADSVIFLPGEDSITINFNPIADGIPEGTESVIITLASLNDDGDTLYSTAIGYILDKTLTLQTMDTTLFCRGDSILIGALADSAIAPYTYEWSTGEMSDSIWVPVDSNGVFEYIVVATDQCGFTEEDTVTVTVNQTLAIDTLLSFPANPCEPTGAVSAQVSGVTGDPLYEWVGPGADSPNSADATVWDQIPPGWYYFTVTDDVCEVDDSVEVTTEGGPTAAINASPTAGCIPVVTNFQNDSENATSYQWDFGGGNIVSTASTDPISQSFDETVTVQLIATDDNDCSDTAYVTINVEPCGCTDPNALNYNENATIDDGSCEYPVPVVTAPNVISPLSGGPNSVFYLTMENVESVELTILNRWGNVIKQETSANPTWDGKGANGLRVGDGTYFYRYKAYGINPENTAEGHGFIQVVNND